MMLKLVLGCRVFIAYGLSCLGFRGVVAAHLFEAGRSRKGRAWQDTYAWLSVSNLHNPIPYQFFAVLNFTPGDFHTQVDASTKLRGVKV